MKIIEAMKEIKGFKIPPNGFYCGGEEKNKCEDIKDCDECLFCNVKNDILTWHEWYQYQDLTKINVVFGELPDSCHFSFSLARLTGPRSCSFVSTDAGQFCRQRGACQYLFCLPVRHPRSPQPDEQRVKTAPQHFGLGLFRRPARPQPIHRHNEPSAVLTVKAMHIRPRRQKLTGSL